MLRRTSAVTAIGATIATTLGGAYFGGATDQAFRGTSADLRSHVQVDYSAADPTLRLPPLSQAVIADAATDNAGASSEVTPGGTAAPRATTNPTATPTPSAPRPTR